MDATDSNLFAVLSTNHQFDSTVRKRILLIGVIALTLCMFLFLHSATHRQNAPTPTEPTTPNSQTPQQERAVASEQSQSANIPGAGLSPRRLSATEWSNAYNRQMQADWQHPIEFYGKVLDENANAVAEANVRFQWSDMTDNVASNSATAESDAQGLFSLHGKSGRSLDVWVSKDGYYAPHEGYRGFLYTLGNDLYSPDIANPVVFKLRKKGQGVELITSQNGVSTQVGVRVPTNGSPVRVDLLKKGPDPSGQLEISQVKPPWNEATTWSFRLSIPDGGLIENRDDFQFQAPESGYQQAIEYSFSKSDPGWTTQVTKQFYVAFGNPRKYGWLRIESNLGQQTVFLTYAINPDGSQNLEPTQ
jgi:hypothetical protein